MKKNKKIILLSLLLAAVIFVNLYLNFLTSFGFVMKFFDGTEQLDINEVIDMYNDTLKRKLILTILSLLVVSIPSLVTIYKLTKTEKTS